MTLPCTNPVTGKCRAEGEKMAKPVSFQGTIVLDRRFAMFKKFCKDLPLA